MSLGTFSSRKHKNAINSFAITSIWMLLATRTQLIISLFQIVKNRMDLPQLLANKISSRYIAIAFQNTSNWMVNEQTMRSLPFSPLNRANMHSNHDTHRQCEATCLHKFRVHFTISAETICWYTHTHTNTHYFFSEKNAKFRINCA